MTLGRDSRAHHCSGAAPLPRRTYRPARAADLWRQLSDLRRPHNHSMPVITDKTPPHHAQHRITNRPEGQGLLLRSR